MDSKPYKNRGITKDFILIVLCVAFGGWLLYQEFDPSPQEAKPGQTAQIVARLHRGKLIIGLNVTDSKGTPRRYLMKSNGRAAKPPVVEICDSTGTKIASIKLRAG